jgi:2-haloalkanoic acid dehalogenase type II
MARLTDFDVLSFDCYGTLIDWETGIRTALAPWRRRENIQVSDEGFIEAFGRYEWEEQEENPALLYPEILGRVMKRMAAGWGVYTTPDDIKAFGRSVGAWPAFPDSPLALAYLKQHFKLVILSNVDRESFSYSNAKLGVEFDHIYTAQDIGSYKPDMENFQYLLSHLEDSGYLPSRILRRSSASPPAGSTGATISRATAPRAPLTRRYSRISVSPACSISPRRTAPHYKLPEHPRTACLLNPKPPGSPRPPPAASTARRLWTATSASS